MTVESRFFNPIEFPPRPAILTPASPVCGPSGVSGERARRLVEGVDMPDRGESLFPQRAVELFAPKKSQQCSLAIPMLAHVSLASKYVI